MSGSLEERRPTELRELMRREVIAGLHGHPKRIPSKYFYDAVGARLFEAICRTGEYYLTRAESAVLGRVAGDLARLAGPGRVVIEPGSGNSAKFALLAEALKPACYVPVEICRDALGEATAMLARRFPWLRLDPRCDDFSTLRMEALPRGRRLIFFPGSTIGNFEPAEATDFLRGLAALAGWGGALLIGVDLKKEHARIEAAYNDRAGLTAAFNRNLLARFNRELDGDFDLRAFAHRAFYHAALGRVEMHLISRRQQQVRLGGEVIRFAARESIHTENSYKYAVAEFQALAGTAGWGARAVWTDEEGLFSVHYFVVAAGGK